MSKLIGNKSITNEGYSIEIVGKSNRKDYYIMLLDNKYTIERRLESFRSGRVKNPFHASVCGIGYIGGFIKKYSTSNSYICWKGMMYRCYSNNENAYVGCTIDEKWHSYITFKEWYDKNMYKIDDVKFDVDKDVLTFGNKLYSESTCLFLPKAVNSFFTNASCSNRTGAIGVHKHTKGRYQATINIWQGKPRFYLGLYDTIEEASTAYKIARNEQTLAVAKYVESLNIYNKEIINRIIERGNEWSV